MNLHEVETWAQFKHVADRCFIGRFHVKEHPEGVEIGVTAGRFCYRVQFPGQIERSGEVKFESAENKLFYDRILDYCRIHSFVHIIDSIPEDLFH